MSRRRTRCRGFTLLPVVLAMTLVAATAFLLNRDNGLNAEMISTQMDSDRARLAAEAGLQAANARVQSSGCSGGFPVAGTPVVNANFGGASYSAYATSGSGNTTSLVSTGTFNGTSTTLTRNNVYVYQTTPLTYTLQPGATAGLDTAIDSSTEKNYGADNALSIKKGQQNLLFKFDLSAFPAGSRPVSATLSIYGSGGLAIDVEFFRMTSAWVEGTSASSPLDGATWNTSNGSTAWTPGGNYHPVRLNAANSGSVLNSWASFDATAITSAWLSGQYPNHGLLVKSTGELGTYKFTSSDDSNAARRPKIEFNYLVPCGATGPVDTPHGSVTLNSTADSFNDSLLTQNNSGASSALKVSYTPTRENRLLISFDTSSVPAGAIVQSATLRMYVSSIASATANPKSVWANAINESWVEGAGNNTSKVCPTATAGTSWNYRTNCSNWSFIHPPNTATAWTVMAPMPTARTNHMVATVNGKIYTIGGYNPVGGYFNTVEEYDPATNTWTAKAPMPTKRSDAAAAVVNGKIYVMGGTINGTSALNVNEVYDPATNTWATKAVMPTGRMFLGATVANSKIYAIGGAKTTSPVRNNEEYDPAANTWVTKTQMPTARKYLSVQSVNGKVYAMGGYTGFASLSTNEEYNPATNAWANKASMPVGTDSMASAVLGNKVYLIGGIQSISTTKTVRVYDVLNNSYTALADYAIPTSLPAAVSVNGYIYSMGGDDAVSVVYTGHYRYDPGLPVPVATAVDESTSASPLASGFSSGWITFEVKALVQEWVDGIRPNNGMVIYTDVPDQLNINSRENNAKNPQLIVTY
jgi:N-acetylneuraminic acid mutarotase